MKNLFCNLDLVPVFSDCSEGTDEKYNHLLQESVEKEYHGRFSILVCLLPGLSVGM